MMTPARRSGGVLASALFRSANRFVPEAVSPLGRDEVTQRTCKLAMPASLLSSSRRIAAVCSGRPPIDWLKLSSTTTMAMLARLSRSSWRSVGLESASSSAASDNARSSAPRLRRRSSSTTSPAASAAPAQNSGAGTMGEKSIDQLLKARSPPVHPPLPAGRGAATALSFPFGHLLRKGRRESPARSAGSSLPKPLQQRRHVHLIGLVVAGEGVHDDIDASAQRHLALTLAARHRRIEVLAALVARPCGGEVVGGDQDRAHAINPARLPTLVAVARSLRLHPQLPAVPAAGERAQQIERLRQHVMFWDRLQTRDIEVAEQPLHRRAALAAQREASRHGLAVVLGVEND